MLYIIVGPTGSGKTALAHQLSDLFDKCPLVNADAFQVYKDLDIGTAKIKKDSPYYSRYQLLDYLSPDKPFSIKDFQDDFRKVVDPNKDYVVVGGSGLYIKAAIYDYSFPEEEQSFDNYDDLSNEELYSMLQELDIEASKNIHPNNRKRVIRAIQIAKSGLTKSEVIESQEHKLLYPCRIIFINPHRDELYEHINKRVDIMIKEGLVDECKMLLEKYELSLTARQAIGYKEIFDYLEGKCSLESAIELIKKRSRNYAKRQVTFFKHQFQTIEYISAEEALKAIKNER